MGLVRKLFPSAEFVQQNSTSPESLEELRKLIYVRAVLGNSRMFPDKIGRSRMMGLSRDREEDVPDRTFETVIYPFLREKSGSQEMAFWNTDL